MSLLTIFAFDNYTCKTRKYKKNSEIVFFYSFANIANNGLVKNGKKSSKLENLMLRWSES